jgi:ribosome biogenesis GTPase A
MDNGAINDKINVQWFPGHMAKARRMMTESVKLVDVVCEIADARIPISSRNPELDGLLAGRPRLLVLNRTDLADPAVTKLWTAHFKAGGVPVMETDARSGRGVSGFQSAVRALLSDKIAALEAKGQGGRPIRAMVVGVPNVGKSTFINKLAGRKAAIASDRPGVTRGKQWISVGGLQLLDTPGLLWPKLDGENVGEHLAFTGAVKDQILDVEALAAHLMKWLAERYPALLTARYKIEPAADAAGWELLEAAARKRGFLISGGEVDTERMSNILLDEFRGGVIGRISLERPGDEP